MKLNKESFLLAVICVISVLMALDTTPEAAIPSGEDSVSTIDTAMTIPEIELDSILYSADSIFYNDPEEIINLYSKAEMQYHTSSLKAEEIIIDLKEGQAYTKGETWIQDGSQVLVGNSISFDFESKKGLIGKGASRLDKGFYYGEEIRKIDDDIYDIDKGYFTTCDSREPHFYIYSAKMRLFHKDKIVAKPIVFYVNHFPILLLPFATFSVKTDRASGILTPEPGYNNVDGKYIENIALYYAYNDYAELLTALDWRELTGWEARLESNYIKRYHYSGSFLARFQNRIVNEMVTREEWYLKARHRQDFLDKSSFDADLEFMSSKTIWEGSADANERLSERITSTVAYRKPFTTTTLNTGATYTENLIDNSKQIVLPTVSYSLPSKPIYELFTSSSKTATDRWWQSFYYSYSLRGVHSGNIVEPKPTLAEILFKNLKDVQDNYLAQHNAGIRHSLGASYNRTFRGWLNFSQSISGSEVWFDRDIEGNKFVRGFEYSTNTRLSHSIYGIGYYPDLSIRAIRHIMTPSIGFNYTPDYSFRKDKYYSFSGIGLGAGKKSRSLSFSLNHKWSLKYYDSQSESEHPLNDFVTLNSSINYDLEKKDDKPFSDINHSAIFRPGNIKAKGISFDYNTNFAARQDAYKFDIINWRVGNTLRVGGESTYRNYFPHEKNVFSSGAAFQPDLPDTLQLAEYDDIHDLSRDFTQLSVNHPWSLNFTHDYSRVVKSKFTTQNLRSSISCRITNNWAVNYSNSYNIEKKELVTQSLSVDRDLHCWKLSFTWSKQGDYWHYRLLFHNIQLPDVLRIRSSEHKR